jgi:beta-galactosidase
MQLWHTSLAALVLAACSALALAQQPAMETSSRRGEICLNGEWRFMPAVGPAAERPDGEWGTIPVPGSWSRCSSLPGPRSQGKGGSWATGALNDVNRAWYEMTVHIPDAWAGRAIVLDLTRVSTDAVVYANGVECGKVAWPRGVVDITRAVRAGDDAALRVLVVAAPQEQDVVVYMGVGNDQVWTRPAQLASRGIIGETFLRSRPAGAFVRGVFVRPSVREGRVSVDVEVGGLQQAGPVSFTARMLDAAGQAEKTFSATRDLRAQETQTVTLQWPWPDPRLWDVGKPELYTLQLAAKGADIDDEYPQVFGFREFWLDGLKFMLNGTEIRLRPVCLRDGWNPSAWVPEAVSNMLDRYTQIGFNLGEHWPNDEDERGSVFLRDVWADLADRKGFLLAGNALSVNDYIFGPNYRFIWADADNKARWEQRMAAQMSGLRNHPSIVMWATSGNLFGRQQDQNPQVIGMRNWYPHDQKAQAGLEAVEIIKRHDPTRPVFTHHGADVGDLHTCNCYLNLIPLQEREEWLSAYARQAQMPFLPIEFGTPLHTTFMRGRNGFGGAVVSEPLMTEFCAIYLGSKAYELETDAYRSRLERTYTGPGQWRNWQGARELDQAPACQAVEELFIRNTWRSWRTWGLTAGMVPWSMGHGWTQDPARLGEPERLPFTPGRRGVWLPSIYQGDLHYLEDAGGWVTYPAGQALIDNDNVTLAWIAGPDGDFTAKDHSFWAGETIRKQAVLINDLRESVPWQVTWTAEVNGLQVGSGALEGTIAPAQNRFLPITFTAPDAARKAQGRIRLTATIGPRQHTDEFSFRVFPPQPPLTGTPVLCFDPEGETTKLLHALGYTPAAWDGSPRPGDLLIIGRHALENPAALPGDLTHHVAAGGKLLILAQSPDWLRKAMGLRVARHVSRRMFPLPNEDRNPILAGLDADDLRDWRGHGTLVAETWGGLDESPNADPEYGWHWGNAGSVTSCAVEKPHASGWRPLLEGEFDLAYSPLMELSLGSGKALLCTLDLEGRTAQDPVAQILTQRVLEYAAKMPPEPRVAKTVYVGGDAGRKLLRGIGLTFEPAPALTAEPALAVIGGDAKVTAEELDAFLNVGGRALLLPRSGDAALGGQLGAEQAFRGASEVPAWPECRGLSLSDLRLRGAVPLVPVTGGGAVAGAGGMLGRYAKGPGVAVLLQLTPDMLPAREKTYLRYSQWRLTRTLTQVLANLGATFQMDERSLTPGWNLAMMPLNLAGDWRLKVERKLPASPNPDQRAQDPGRAPETAGWESPDLDPADWTPVKMPGYWEALPQVGEADGAFWLRREVRIPERWRGKELILQLGNVDDRDVTWFNGTKVGETSGWNAPRSYRIPANLVRDGVNVIVLRVFDEFGAGGLGGRPDDLRIGPAMPPPQPEGDELLVNTDFADDLKGWNVSISGEAQGQAALTTEVPGELLGQRSLRVDITKASPVAWHASVRQPGLSQQAGVTYIWSVWAKASKPATAALAIEKDHPPYGGAGLFQRTTIGTDWQRVEIKYTPTESDEKVSYSFQELARDAVTFWFAAPSFSVAPALTNPPEATEVRSFYHPDYAEGHALGDDPYRYYRW